jgi:hypothetical protein
VWGERDRTIPLEHGRRTHAAAPMARFEPIPGSGHFPHLERPAELAELLRDFLQTTTPARLDASGWRDLLESRPAGVGLGGAVETVVSGRPGGGGAA